MADYQSLLARAVANLPDASSPANRQAIYERARKALLTQLRTLRPPLPESDIEREERALDNAIAAVESKFGASEISPAPQLAPAAPPGQAQPAPTKPATPPAAGQPPPDAGTPARPAASAQAALKTVAQDPKPMATAPAPRQTPSRPAAPLAAAIVGKPSPRPPLVMKDAEAPPASNVPPVRVERQMQSLPDAAAGGAKSESSLGAANLAKVIPADHAAPERADAPPVVANRDENEIALAAAAEAPTIDVAQAGPARAESESLRPQAPSVLGEKRKSWPWLALAVALGVVLSIAVAAIVTRQKPQDLAIAPPEAHEEAAPPPPAKIAQRAEPAPAEETPSPPPAAAGEKPAAQPSAQAEQAANPAVESQNLSARAAMLIASPDNPQKPIVNLGSTVWSTIPPAPGQPESVAVKAEAEIPDLKMHATMVLRKNTDPTLQATHTIDLRFAFADGAPFTGFKDVGLPQMRKLDATASEAMSAVKVKISDVYFLIALAKSDSDTARNLDLMQTRAWFDFPLLLNDNRIAKLVFQKSADGEAMLEKALDAWKEPASPSK
ncbi:MAG: hypothetical protein JO288_16485 [Hyphomicrobiales bacterium]|nr:hypothetical protein [Hyphomicrobiales bacterium]